MKIGILFFLISFTTVAFITGCSKEYSVEGNTVTITDYYPTTTGTYWVNQDDNTGDTFTMKVVNADTVLGGRTFRLIQSDDPFRFPDLRIAKQSGNYFTRSKALSDLLGTIGGTPLPVTIPDSILNREELILKDYVANGSNWNNNFDLAISSPPPPLPPIPLTITLQVKYTITEKAVSKIINGFNFPDVITVKTSVSASIPIVGTQDILTMENSYARAVGPVQQIVSITAGTPQTISYSVKNYHVMP